MVNYRTIADTAVAQDVPAPNPRPYGRASFAACLPATSPANQETPACAFRITTRLPGGINCDSDCSTMASGQKVAAWVNGRDGTYAAACPRVGVGTRFRLYGRTYECQDRGGWIKARHPGDYDPAMGGYGQRNLPLG